MKAIIYKQDNGVPAIMTPTPDCLKKYSIFQIAIKDVPAGKKFKIVDIADLPQNAPQEAWIINDADLTDGIGGKSNEF
jgi:hypothetical protein